MLTLSLVNFIPKTQSYQAFFLVKGNLVLVFVLYKVATKSEKSGKTKKYDKS